MSERKKRLRGRGGRPSICLTMIVKDEAGVIERCLRSVRPFIDCWSIVDTGSKDGTQERIKRMLSDLPGDLHERPWKNFGHNRTEALALARPRADYSLVIDADETFEVPDGFVLPPLTADGYYTRHRGAGSTVTFDRLQFLKTDTRWRYEGVLHEVAVCDGPFRTERMEGPLCVGHFDGARNQIDAKEKYARDAALLEEALKEEPNNARYRYYLARSYRDAGMREKALENFAKRADMGGWDEEVWHSLHLMGVLCAELQRYHAAVAAQLRAHQLRPQRAEALCALAQLHRMRDEHHLAYIFARQAVRIPRPDDRLFVDEAVYRWRSLDELCVAAFWVGEHEESLRAAQELLQNDAVPEEQRHRIEKNLRLAQEKLSLSSGTVDMEPLLTTPGRLPAPAASTHSAGRSLLELVPLERPIRIADVGASPVEGPPPYQRLMDGSRTELIGFEPNPEAYAQLQSQLAPHQRMLPNAIGDGGVHTLHFCQAPGMNSLLPPDPTVLEKFHLFGEFGAVLRTQTIATKRLDDLEEVGAIDFLKLDVQGFEKTILEHGRNRLRGCLVVHTEAAFVPMYRGQPCLGEVDTLLRELGFVVHTVASLKRWAVAPLLIDNDPRKGLNQLLEGDFVYVRNFFELKDWDDASIARLIHILHFAYGSFDLAYYLVRELMRRRSIAPEAPHQYLELIGMR